MNQKVRICHFFLKKIIDFSIRFKNFFHISDPENDKDSGVGVGGGASAPPPGVCIF
jgi:hypothetical protein